MGVQHTRSIQIPMMIDCSIARKRAGFVGKGLNVWPAVHIEDSAFRDCSMLGIDKTHLRDGDR